MFDRTRSTRAASPKPTQSTPKEQVDRLTLIKLLQSTHFVVNKSIQQRIDDASYLSSIAWNSLAADEQTDRPKVKQVWIVVIIFWGAVTNTTAHHLGQYSLHLLPLKSSMYRVRRRRYFDRVTATAQISGALVMLAFQDNHNAQYPTEGKILLVTLLCHLYYAGPF